MRATNTIKKGFIGDVSSLLLKWEFRMKDF